MNATPIVSIRSLNHTFGQGSLRKQTLFDINLDLYPGEIVLLTGPSGSGKTTLLTLIGGLRAVQEGSAVIFGKEVCGVSPNQLVSVRRSIGYIFQGHNLLKSLTARQNVQMSMEVHAGVSGAEAIARSLEMLEGVGLSDRADYYPANLSGGQKQRVAIARALVSHPRLVLADEPTAALDSQSGRAVVEIMQRLARDQGCTILMVTHDHRILDVAERIVTIEDGRLRSGE